MIKSRSSLLAPAHPGSPGKRAVKRLWWCGINRKHKMINLNNYTKSKPNSKPTPSLRTAHMCVHITVHNCHTHHSTVLIIFPLTLHHHCSDAIYWRKRGGYLLEGKDLMKGDGVLPLLLPLLGDCF